MTQEFHFIITKGEDCYRIMECSNSDVKQAFMTEGKISGDREVLLRLSRIVPGHETLRNFVEKNSGRLICVYDH